MNEKLKQKILNIDWGIEAVWNSFERCLEEGKPKFAEDWYYHEIKGHISSLMFTGKITREEFAEAMQYFIKKLGKAKK